MQPQPDRLEQAGNEILAQIIEVYGRMYARLQPYIDALTNAIPEDATQAQVRNLPEYKRLIDQAERELTDFYAYLRPQLDRAGTSGVTIGVADASALLLAGISSSLIARGIDEDIAAGVVAETHITPPGDPLSVLAEYLAPGKPIDRWLRTIAGDASQDISSAILKAVGEGKNPLTIANDIERTFGVNLTSAMRLTRTVQLYSYRGATQQTYNANGVVKWQWSAKLDGLTCMSCIALHGKIFDSRDAISNDHYNGRCAMLPVVDPENDGLRHSPKRHSGGRWAMRSSRRGRRVNSRLSR